MALLRLHAQVSAGLLVQACMLLLSINTSDASDMRCGIAAVIMFLLCLLGP